MDEFSCVRGQRCHLTQIHGVGLQAKDEVALARSCADVAALYATNVSLEGGRLAAVVPEASLRTLRPDVYVACWCPGTRDCGPRDFRTLVGGVEVAGPERGQKWACARGRRCELRGLEGVALAAGDVMRAMLECGVAAADFPTADATINGTLVDLGIVRAAPGIYEVCWCRPHHADHGCEAVEDFGADVGILYVEGPYAEDFECDLGRPCHGTERGGAAWLLWRLRTRLVVLVVVWRGLVWF